MHDYGTAVTAMLGLPGFRLVAVSEYAGELEQAVETVEDVTGCPVCGVVATLHDRRPTYVRDLPSGGRPVTLVWVKRVWRCRDADCPKVTWTETSTVIGRRTSLTERARAEVCRRVGEDGHSVAQVAAAFGGLGGLEVLDHSEDQAAVVGDKPCAQTGGSVVSAEPDRPACGDPAGGRSTSRRRSRRRGRGTGCG